jgi:branched-chain amino acid transport system permease protein
VASPTKSTSGSLPSESTEMGFVASQLLVLTAVRGLNYALFALAFALYFRLTHRFDILFAGFFSTGAYLFVAMERGVGLLLAVVICALLPIGFVAIAELLVFGPIERWSRSRELPLIASLGAYMIVENSLAAAFGDDAFLAFPSLERPLLRDVAGTALVTLGQFLSISISLIALAAIHTWYRRTSTGLLARALTSNPTLAVLHGVRPVLTSLLVALVCVGGTIASGITYSLDLELRPTIGLRVLVAAVAITLSSTSMTVPSMVFRGFALAGLEVVGMRILGARWCDAPTYILFLVFAATAIRRSRSYHLRLQ